MSINLIDYFSLAVFAFLLGAQLFWRPQAFKLIKLASYVSVIGVFLVLIIYSIVLYFFWEAATFSRLLLPPHTSITYFLFFILTRFWGQYLVSLFIALIFGLTAYKLNSKFGNRFMELEEPYLIFLALFFIGHPFWVIYFISILAAEILFIIIRRLLGDQGRVSFYYLWLAVAIFVIILKEPNPLVIIPGLESILKVFYLRFKL